MNTAENTPGHRPPLRALLEEVRTANEAVDSHRRNLVERIGQLRAMADDREAEAVTRERLGHDAVALKAEAARLNEQAQLLSQRIGQLLGELYGAPGTAGAPVRELKTWQREAWWTQLATAVDGLRKLAACAATHAEQLGAAGREALERAAAQARRLIDGKPADVSSAAMDPLLVLRSAAEDIAPTPWHLLDVDPQSGAQLVLLLHALCKDFSGQEAEPRENLLAACRRRLVLLLESMGSHPESGRAESALQLLADENLSAAAAILSGLAPPDPLRYEVNQLVLLLSSLA